MTIQIEIKSRDFYVISSLIFEVLNFRKKIENFQDSNEVTNADLPLSNSQLKENFFLDHDLLLELILYFQPKKN